MAKTLVCTPHDIKLQLGVTTDIIRRRLNVTSNLEQTQTRN